jgi:hypothetical protein
MDALSYTAYVDAPSLETMRKRGEEPMKNLTRSIKADNEILRLVERITFGKRPVSICLAKYRIELPREIVVLGPPLFCRENMDASDLLLAEIPRDILSGD